MSLERATLDRIVSLVEASLAPTSVEVPSLGLVMLRSADGVVTERAIPKPLRIDALASVDLVDVVKSGVVPGPCVVYVHEKCIAGMPRSFDVASSPVVTCTMSATTQWRVLESLVNRQVFTDMTSLRNFLRLDLRAEPADPIFSAIEAVDFKTASQTKAGASKGSDTLGRQVAATVEAGTPIPDHVFIRAFPFDCANVSREIAVDVTLRAREGAIMLSVDADVLHDAKAEAVHRIADSIRNALVAPGEDPQTAHSVFVASASFLNGLEDRV